MAEHATTAINLCPGFCSISACDWCGEMAHRHNDGHPFCSAHPDAKIVTLRRETCPHGPNSPDTGGEP